jgi:hypothetical protein
MTSEVETDMLNFEFLSYLVQELIDFRVFLAV